MAFHHALPRLRARAAAKHRFTNVFSVLLCLKLARRQIYLGNLYIDLLISATKLECPFAFLDFFKFFFVSVFFLNLFRSPLRQLLISRFAQGQISKFNVKV